MTQQEQKELEQSINELENDIEPNYTERQEELDWMSDRLCEMRREDFKNFIAFIVRNNINNFCLVATGWRSFSIIEEIIIIS